jgi:O-antigen ligase
MSGERPRRRVHAAPADAQGHGQHESRLSLGLLVLLVAVLTRLSRYTRASVVTWGGADTAEMSFRAWDIDPSKATMAMAACLLALAVLLRPRIAYLRMDLPLKLLFALVAFSLISLLWAYDPGWSLMWTLRLVQTIGVYVLVLAFTRTRDDLRWWGHLFLYASFVNLAGMIQEAIAPETFVHLGGRAGQATRIYLAAYPGWGLLFLPFALHYLLFGRNRRETALGGLALIANLVTLYLSFRRAAPLALGLALLSYLLLIGHRRRGFVLLLAGIALAAGLTIALNPTYAQRLGTIPWLGGATLKDWEGSTRLIQYLAGLEIFRRHPIWGIGLGGPMLWIRDVYGFPEVLGQHSMFLALATSLGLVGLIIYVFFLISAADRTMRALRAQVSVDPRAASLSAAILSSLVAMLFWGQIQCQLYTVRIYLCAALGSVACEVLTKHVTARSRQRQQQPEGP